METVFYWLLIALMAFAGGAFGSSAMKAFFHWRDCLSREGDGDGE